MPNANSQEQTIYRSLAGQIQLGFYDNGEKFPSALEVAQKFQVSYCPAQRALKQLEKNGYIELCRGKATAVLDKPYRDYLGSDVFKGRVHLLADLTETLDLISPIICYQGMCHLNEIPYKDSRTTAEAQVSPGKYLYQTFDQFLQAFGSQTILSLYYDISSYIESAFLDILRSVYGRQEMNLFLRGIVNQFSQCLQSCQDSPSPCIKQQLEHLSQVFSKDIKKYLEAAKKASDSENQEAFSWTVRKGRTHYCDVVAIDLICKINQGIYPVGSLLPNIAVLANVYHVSVITMRRTIALLNKLGVVKNINGVGSRVIYRGDSTMPSKFRDFMLDDNLKVFLEALQLLSITCERVLEYTFPHFTEENNAAIVEAVSLKDEKRAMVTTVSACMQAVVRCCPLEAIREIYRQITLLLLNGSVLRLNETGEEQVPNWQTISGELLESLKRGDSTGFSRVFYQLSEDIFTSTKETLLELGIKGIREITTPYH